MMTQADREAAQEMLNHAFRNAEISGDIDFVDIVEHFTRHRESALANSKSPAKLRLFDELHGIATDDLGYGSILEALEDVDRLKATISSIHAARPTPSPASEEEVVERVARAIDPIAWDDELWVMPGGAGQQLAQQQAFYKARAALSALPPREGVVERTINWLRQCSDWLLTNDLDMQCPMDEDPIDLANALSALPPRDEELREENRRLREALEPFAKAAEHYQNDHNDNEIKLPRSYCAGKDDRAPLLHGRDFRRALRALRREQS